MSQYLMACPNCIVKEIYPSHTDTTRCRRAPHWSYMTPASTLSDTSPAGAPAVVDKRGHGLGPKGYGALVAGFTKLVWLQATQRCILKSKETSFWGKDMISSDWKTFHFYRTRDHMISSQGRQLLGALRWRGQGTEPSLAIWAPPLPHGLPDETPG